MILLFIILIIIAVMVISNIQDNAAAKRAAEERRIREEEQKKVEHLIQQAEEQHRQSQQEKLDLLAQMSEMHTRTKSRAEEGHKDGFVYVLSNEQSFGQNVYKIGMTRRKELSTRVGELNSASIPFNFKVEGGYWVDNAAEMEGSIHDCLDHRRMNKYNKRKEFFIVGKDELNDTLKSHGLKEI